MYCLGGIKMNGITSYLNTEEMIYEIRCKQVMLDSEISATKLYDKEYWI